MPGNFCGYQTILFKTDTYESEKVVNFDIGVDGWVLRVSDDPLFPW